VPFGFISTISTFMRLMIHVTPIHHGDRLKIHLDMENEQISGILFFLVEKVLFKESPPSIMVTRNPNWSIVPGDLPDRKKQCEGFREWSHFSR